MEEKKVPMIYAAVCGVMEDVGAVGKGDYNKSQGFKYRGIDSVMNALNPAMIKHKVFCTPEVLEQSREERTTAKGGSLIYSVCRMRYRFYTTDGSFVEAVVVGEGMDSGDKATNKAMAVAFKYACFQTFCIPTENLMDDPDAETPDPSSKKASSQKGAAKKAGTTGTSPEEGDQDTAKYGGKNDTSRKQPDAQKQPNENKKVLMEELSRELIRTGYGWGAVIKTYKVDCVESLTALQIKDCITKMKKQPDKAVDG